MRAWSSCIGGGELLPWLVIEWLRSRAGVERFSERRSLWIGPVLVGAFNLEGSDIVVEANAQLDEVNKCGRDLISPYKEFLDLLTDAVAEEHDLGVVIKI